MDRRRPYGLLIAAIFGILLLLFLYSIAEILLLLFISVLFSIYLGWITDALQERLGLPRALGVASALALTLLGLIGIGYLIVPPVAAQTQELIHALPTQLQALELQLLDLARRSPIAAGILGEAESPVASILAEVGGHFRGLVPYLFSGFTFLIHFFSVLIMGIYLALRPGLYREGFVLLAPPVHRELVRDILADLGSTLRAWIGGQLIAMATLGTFTWIGLELLGVPFALAFGVFTGVVAIVPFFGTLVSTILPALFVLVPMGVGTFLLVLLLGVVVHLFEANVVSPMIMERQVHLPPVLTLLSVLVMAHLLHFVGLLVAVPVLATVMVITRRIYVSRILEGKGFRRTPRDEAIEIRLPPGDGVLVHPAGLAATVPALLED